MGTVSKMEHKQPEASEDAQERIVREVMKLLPELSKAIQQSMPASVRHEGVSTAQVKAMVHLAEYGPQTMGDLAAGLRITTPSATGLVNPLADMGFVVRERSEEDRRVVWVRLSDEAEQMAEQILHERNAEVRVALEGMSASAQADFLDGLQRLADRFGKTQKRPRAHARRVSTGQSTPE